MRSALVLAAIALLAACVPQPARQVERYHVLEARGAPPQAEKRRESTLVVMSTAASFYETRAMAYSREPGTRAYYQYNRWTEPPSQQLGTQLITWLQASGAFATVASARSAVAGTLLLTVHIEHIYHDAAEPPGTAHLALTAELTDPSRRTLVSREKFGRAMPAPAYDASGAVAAFDAAAGALLAEVVAWVDATAPR
jgi:cholesterol transport system auxiliary component